eukprot:gene11274-18906_t
MSEGASFRSASGLRELFAMLLTDCDVAEPQQLWNDFSYDLCEDLLHRARVAASDNSLPLSPGIQDHALWEVEIMLQSTGRSLRDYHMVVPHPPTAPAPGQRIVYNSVMGAIAAPAPGDSAYFLYSPGGCGKTFVLNLLLNATRAQGKIALAVASSGIAALLLEGGSTAHSRFGIPLLILGDSVCSIDAQSAKAQLLRQASLIIWDEAPMTHKHCYEAVDRMLRDFMQNDLPFGGKIVVMAGDFRQILPVIQRGTRSQIVGAALCNSPLWNHFTLLQLTENMRVQRLLAQGRDATAQAHFSSLLLDIGEGRIGNPMQVPADILLPGTDPRGLVDWVYSDLRNPAEYIHKAILTPKNSDVDKINDMVMNRLPGQARTSLPSLK